MACQNWKYRDQNKKLPHQAEVFKSFLQFLASPELFASDESYLLSRIPGSSTARLTGMTGNWIPKSLLRK
jgi:hypothetical protein